MDFHNLKRKELQELCKKHKIPANLTNLEMATRLTALLTGDEKPLTRGRRSCLKGFEDNVSENESDVEKRPAKKVRFSPQNEMIEFEKSEVKVLERRNQGRRKSVMNLSKGSGRENGSHVAVVDEGVGRVTRSRRGKVIEGGEVESMGGAKKGMKDDALKDRLPSAAGVVVTSRDAVMDGGAGRKVTRSRKVKSIEGTVVEIKGGRRGKKGDDLKGKLTSAAADNVPLVNATNEELVELGKRSLRNRVVGERKRENNVVEKGSRQNEEHEVARKRSLRNIEPKDEEDTENEDAKKGSTKNGSHRIDKGRKDIAGTKSTEEESEGIQPEKVLRRSRRHVVKVDYHNLVSENVRKNEKVGKGRSRSMVFVELKEGSGVDHISGMVVKEGSSAENNLRRSKRNAVKPEGLVTMEQIDDVANANEKKETKKRRRDAIGQEQVVKVDGNSVEVPLRRSRRNTERSETVIPTIARGKVAQKEKGRSKKTKGEVEDSFTEKILTIEDLPGPEAELMMPEVAENTVMDNFNDTSIDLFGCLSDIESADASESNSGEEDKDSKPVSDSSVKNDDSSFTNNGVQKKAPGANVKSVHLPLDDNDVQKQGGKAYTDEVKLGENDSEQALYLRKTPLTVKNNSLERHVCSDVIVELHDVGGITGRMISETNCISLCELTKEQQVPGTISDGGQLNLEESDCRDHENLILPNAVCEVATTDTVDGCTLDTAATSLKDADENEKEELTGTLHSTETLKQRKEFLPIQRNSFEAQNLSATDTNFNHHALTFSVDAKFEDDSRSKIECGISDNCCQPNASDAFRINATRELQDGNVGNGVEINQPVDLQGKDFVATPISAKAVENVSEFSESGFGSRMADPSKCNLTLELQDDLNCEVTEESPYTMGLETHSELRAQSPSEQGKGSVEAELCEDGHNLVESSNHEDIGHLEHQDDALDYSCQKDQGVTESEDSVAISDAQGVVLLLHGSESIHISKGAKCTEIELSASESSSISTIPTNSSSMLKYQAFGTTVENEHCSLTNGNAEYEGYGAGNEVGKKKEVPMQELYTMKMPSTIEDDALERCNMSADEGSKGVTGVWNDQQGPMEESMEYGSNFKSGCKVAIEGQKEVYIGEEDNLVKNNCNALENHLNLIAISEATTTAIVDDCLPVAVDTPLKNTAENHQGKNTSIMNSRKTLKQTEESTPVQRTVYEAHNPSASEATLDHLELNTSGKSKEPVPDASRKMLHDRNVNGCDIFVQPSSLQGMVFTSTQICSTTVETRTEFSENFSHITRAESPKSNFNFEFPDFTEDSCFTCESKSSPLPDNSLQKQGASTDNVGSDEQPAQRTQSPRKQRMAADEEVEHLRIQDTASDDCLQHTELDSSTRSKYGLEDMQNHVEAKFGDVEHLRDQDTAGDDCLQHTELDSSTRSKYGFIQDQGVSNAEDTVETADLHLVAEAYTALEDWQNHVEEFKFKEDGHLKDQETALDDFLQYAELECSAGDAVEIADSHLSPPGVATHIIEGRQREIELSTRKCISMIKTPTNSNFILECQLADTNTEIATRIIEGRQREIELSTRKCNSMTKTPTNSNFILECQLADTNTEIALYHLTDENVQNEGYGTCSEGERDKENDPVEELDMIQMPSTSKFDGLEGSIISMAGSLCGPIDVLNVEQGSMTQVMESNGERVCDSETNKVKEMKKSCTGEEDKPCNLEATNNNELKNFHSFDAALEDKRLEILLTERVSVSSTRQEKNILSHENETENDIVSLKKVISPGREGSSCQSDEVVSRQEQGQDTSSHKDSVNAATAAENEIKGTTQQKIFPNAAEGTTDGWNSSYSWHGDELKMLFCNSVNGPEDDILQETDEGAFSNSNYRVASAEYRDHIVLSNGSPVQHDEHKICDSGIQKEIKVGEDNQNDEHADSVAEVHMLRRLDMNIPPEERKEDDSSPLDQNKDVGEETGTSIAIFVSERVIIPGIDAKDKVGELDLQDPVASESSISKSHEKSRENIVDSMIDYAHSGTVKVADTHLIEPEVESAEATVDAASKNERSPIEDQEEGEARVNNRCLENSGGVLEDTSAMRSKTISSLSKNLDSVEGESIKSPTKQFTSTVKKKNARTILIHGTPNKLPMTVDMKENAPNSKLENVGTWTTVRPAAKRPALKDLPHK